jgi:multisubunit Na+/H+ antiporter MnhG subunit
MRPMRRFEPLRNAWSRYLTDGRVLGCRASWSRVAVVAFAVEDRDTAKSVPGEVRSTVNVDVWISALILLVSGAVLVAIGRKQSSGTLERNWLTGVRTRETTRSDAAWEAAHAATARLIIGAGIVPIVAGAGMLVLRPNDDSTIATIVLGALGVTLALAVTAGVQGHRIARQVNEGVAEDRNHDDS